MISRTLCWVSGGAASVVAARLILVEDPEALLVRCETNNEDEDNYRFEADVERWLDRSVTVLRSEEYASVVEVWERARYMAGVAGAPCTVAMKVVPRLAFQKPFDVHVFGYTADWRDVTRFERLKATYPELRVRAPLIERGVTKAGTLAMIENAGLRLPRSYAMGFPNANCLQTGCVKATSPAYWALFRQTFPERFARMADLSRQIGARLVEKGVNRLFLDELPKRQSVLKPVAPACDFLCHIAEKELEASDADWSMK